MHGKKEWERGNDHDSDGEKTEDGERDGNGRKMKIAKIFSDVNIVDIKTRILTY